MGGMNLYTRKTSLFYCCCTDSKPLHNVMNFLYRHSLWMTKLTSWQSQLYGRRCFRIFIDQLLRLTTSMTYLCPKLVAVTSCGGCPACQGIIHLCAGRSINNDITRTFKMVFVDNNISRQQHTSTSVTPQTIESRKLRRWYSLSRC